MNAFFFYIFSIYGSSLENNHQITGNTREGVANRIVNSVNRNTSREFSSENNSLLMKIKDTPIVFHVDFYNQTISNTLIRVIHRIFLIRHEICRKLSYQPQKDMGRLVQKYLSIIDGKRSHITKYVARLYNEVSNKRRHNLNNAMLSWAADTGNIYEAPDYSNHSMHGKHRGREIRFLLTLYENILRRNIVARIHTQNDEMFKILLPLIYVTNHYTTVTPERLIIIENSIKTIRKALTKAWAVQLPYSTHFIFLKKILFAIGHRDGLQLDKFRECQYLSEYFDVIANSNDIIEQLCKAGIFTLDFFRPIYYAIEDLGFECTKYGSLYGSSVDGHIYMPEENIKNKIIGIIKKIQDSLLGQFSDCQIKFRLLNIVVKSVSIYNAKAQDDEIGVFSRNQIILALLKTGIYMLACDTIRQDVFEQYFIVVELCNICFSYNLGGSSMSYSSNIKNLLVKYPGFHNYIKLAITEYSKISESSDVKRHGYSLLKIIENIIVVHCNKVEQICDSFLYDNLDDLVIQITNIVCLIVGISDRELYNRNCYEILGPSNIGIRVNLMIYNLYNYTNVFKNIDGSSMSNNTLQFNASLDFEVISYAFIPYINYNHKIIYNFMLVLHAFVTEQKLIKVYKFTDIAYECIDILHSASESDSIHFVEKNLERIMKDIVTMSNMQQFRWLIIFFYNKFAYIGRNSLVTIRLFEDIRASGNDRITPLLEVLKSCYYENFYVLTHRSENEIMRIYHNLADQLHHQIANNYCEFFNRSDILMVHNIATDGTYTCPICMLDVQTLGAKLKWCTCQTYSYHVSCLISFVEFENHKIGGPQVRCPTCRREMSV